MKHMKQITCITCPIGCRIKIESANKEFLFSGNKCQKGAEFALAELTSPVRSLTTTVKTIFPDMPVLPVKTNGEVPKEKIPAIMSKLSKVTITKNIDIGETVVENILRTGCDIIATGSAGQ